MYSFLSALFFFSSPPPLTVLRGSQTAVYLALNPHEKVELYYEMAAVTAAWFQDKLTAVSFWISEVWS